MPSPKAQKSDPKLIQLVDEIGDLERELAPAKLKVARLELLRKSLRARYVDAKADAFYTAEGLRFSIVVGAKENQKSIDTAKLVKLIGAANFSEFAVCTLKALEEYAGDTYDEVVSIAATGSRSLKITEKGKAA